MFISVNQIGLTCYRHSILAIDIIPRKTSDWIIWWHNFMDFISSHRFVLCETSPRRIFYCCLSSHFLEKTKYGNECKKAKGVEKSNVDSRIADVHPFHSIVLFGFNSLRNWPIIIIFQVLLFVVIFKGRFSRKLMVILVPTSKFMLRSLYI